MKQKSLHISGVRRLVSMEKFHKFLIAFFLLGTGAVMMIYIVYVIFGIVFGVENKEASLPN